MFLKEFNQKPSQKIGKLNKLLNEQFGLKLPTNTFISKQKLVKLRESAEQMLVQLRNSNKKFHLEPEYAKFLGLRDLTETMLKEGMYAESPAFQDLKSMVADVVKELMDKGYTDDEASKECMNRYRMDPRFAYDDEVVMPLVLNAARQYVESCQMENAAVEGAALGNTPDLGLNEKLMRALAKECGVRLEDLNSISAIEEKLDMFASVSGRSRDAVVGFLNGLEEDAVAGGIQMFGRKVAEQNAFTKARRDAIKKGEKKFSVGGKEYNVTGDKELDESAFDIMIDEILNEEVNVEQAEVVIAVRALADDIQDMVERMGRMVNEDIPAIADQMRAEMGAQQAQSFTDAMNSALQGHMDATRQIKATVDSQVSTLSGEAPAASADDMGMGSEPALGGDAMGADLGGEPDLDAIASEPQEPMGRAEV